MGRAEAIKTGVGYFQRYHCLSLSVAGADPGRGDWDDCPPKNYENNFIHHNFVQYEKQHSRYKAIVSSIAFT